MTSHQFDVVSIGETMLRLTPNPHVRIDQATAFNIEVGGTESNTLVGLSRLGLACAWISRLPKTPLGRLVSEGLNRHGVNTDYVHWCDDGRMGLYFYEDAAPPRRSQVIYDRLNSAASTMQRDDLDHALFSAQGSRLLHLTGITPAISASAARTVDHALTLAQQAGWLVSIDLNYRSLLWPPQAARDVLAPLISKASLVISSHGDVKTIFGIDGNAERTLDGFRQINDAATLVLTLGDQGACACSPQSEVRFREPIATTAIGRLGGGDAFAAGFIFSWLNRDATHDQAALDDHLDWGVAAASLKYATPGDMAIIDKNDIVELLSGDRGTAGVRR